MSLSPIVDRIRIIPRPNDFLDRNVGASGEIFFNAATNSLRVYTGKNQGGFEIARSDLSNIPNSNLLAKSTAAGLASETFVDTAISNIPAVDLSSYAPLSNPTFTGTVSAAELQMTGTLVTKSSTEIVNTQTEYSYNEYNFAQGNVWLVSNPTSTNLSLQNIPGFPANTYRATAITLVISQGADPVIPGSAPGGFSSTAVNDYPVEIKWLGGTAPTGTANGTDVVSYVVVGTNLLASVSSYSEVS